MTPIELRLRQRIDELRDERDQARELYDTLRETVTERSRTERPRFGRCGWCGVPTYGRACDTHRDVEHDLEDVLRGNPTPTPATGSGKAPGSD
jgi:hypothetical protein